MLENIKVLMNFSIILDIISSNIIIIGVALFEYKDVIPITAAFEWYKSLGPNLTVYDFLKLSSTLRSSRPSTNFQNLGALIPKIQYGENVAIISDKIIFRDKSSDLSTFSFLFCLLLSKIKII